MSAAVCGSKRSFFEEVSSPTVSKRHRCSSTSPIRCFSPPTPLDQLISLFPDMEHQFLERALEECGNDLDHTIKSLHELCIASNEKPGADDELCADILQGNRANDRDATIAFDGNSTAADSFHATGTEWVELFVKEMTSATSMDDAKARATRVLEVLEKSISARACEEAAQTAHKESMMWKGQIEVLMKENTILKRAVAIQHERHKDFEEKNKELEQLKQLVPQYQEQLRTLEVNNYALTMHLRQAQQNSTIPGRFNPDVF